MDVINVNNRQVIKCVHCSGTGICQHSDFEQQWQVKNETKYSGWVLACTRCGKGHWYHDQGGFFTYKPPPRNQMKAPVCAICGGTGHIVVG